MVQRVYNEYNNVPICLKMVHFWFGGRGSEIHDFIVLI